MAAPTLPSTTFIRSPIWLFMNCPASQPAIPPMMIAEPTDCLIFHRRSSYQRTVSALSRERDPRKRGMLAGVSAGLRAALDPSGGDSTIGPENGFALAAAVDSLIRLPCPDPTRDAQPSYEAWKDAAAWELQRQHGTDATELPSGSGQSFTSGA
jgi:hypothetical protein